MKMTKVRRIVLSILLSGLLLIGVDSAWGTKKHQKVETLNPSEIRAALNDLIEVYQDEYGNDVTPVRTATLVVAASDSSAKSKAQADYLCDGVDDQVQIQAAIDALPAGGGKVTLLEGNYNINPTTAFYIEDWFTAITITGSNITVRGTGGTILKLIDGLSNNNYIFNIKRPASNIVIKDISFDLNGGTSTAEYQGAIFLNALEEAGWIEDVFIENNYFKNPMGHSIYGDSPSARRISVIDNTFVNTLGGLQYGVSLHNQGNYSIISNNKFVDGRVNIHIDRVTNVVIANNIITGSEVYQGIFLYDEVKNCVIIGNHIESLRAVGHRLIQIEDKADPEPVSSGNLFIGNYLQGQATQTGIWINRGNANIFRQNVLAGMTTPVVDTGTNNVYYRQHSDHFQDCVALSTTYVHAAITGTGAEQEITTAITNPDVPRNVSITNSANSTGDVTIEGIDAKGNSVSEAITIVTGGTAYGVKPFSTVTKIIIPATVVNPDTIAVGISDKLGLLNVIYATADVYKVKKNNADVTIGTVDATNGTVDCATITGADDFTIYYRSNLNIIS